jgi:glycosyltransferase involved in cell wall biosynthesis
MRLKPSNHVAVLLYGLYLHDSRVRRQSEALAAMGYKVDVIALREDRSERRYVLNGVHVRQLPIRRRRGRALSYCLQYCCFFVLASAWLNLLFITHRYRVVHVNNMPDFIVFCALIPRLCGARVVLDIHDPFPELFSLKLPSRFERLLARLLRAEERISTAFVNHVITTTELIATTLVARGVPPEKITVVMNTPDSAIFDPALYPGSAAGPVAESFVILFAGTIVKRNGLDRVVRMLPHVRARIPHLCFRIIGNGEGVDDLLALADQLGVRDMIDMRPMLPADAIPRECLLSHAVFWFPDRNPFIDIVMSTKVLEALAMGVPVITARTPCLEHYFPNGEVIFVDACDPATLSTAMLDLYDHYETYKPTPRQTAAFKARFAWDKDKSDYGQLIRQLSGRNQESSSVACSDCVSP